MTSQRRDRPPDAPTVVERPASARSQPRADDVSTLIEPSHATPPVVAPAAGLVLGDVLGVGGMGIVYAARQLELDRPVAYKRLLDAASDEMRARFLREARLTAQLDHPNIVPVHLLDAASGEPPGGYAMKLVAGKTLAQLLDEAVEQASRGALDLEHALQTRLDHFLKICDALAFAHERRVIHRDIKPANVMIGAFGAVYLMDWGIARMLGSSEPELSDHVTATGTDEVLTRVGVRIGSAQYMAPEQALGRTDEVDAFSDQYALGLLLQELVTLQPAITRDSELAAIEAAERGVHAPLDHVDGKPRRVPRELHAIIARATRFEKRMRYPSVQALADDVRRYLRGEAVDALPEGPIARALRFASKHRRASLVAVVGVLAAAAMLMIWTRYQHANRQLAERVRGARLTEVYGEVARQARRIDGQLFELEEALEGLTHAAAWALESPEPPLDQAPLFFDTDFAEPSRRPPDFSDRTAYRWPVSVEHPVIGVAPDVDRAVLLPKLRRLSPLRHHIQRMVVAASGDATAIAPEDVAALLRSRASPIDYAYVDLPEGVHFMWPGYDALPPGYDVRTASFYKMSAGKRGKRWGEPYVDSTTDSAGDDLVLPCTAGIWSQQGEFVGVAGVEITVTKLVESHMLLPARATLRATLVNASGDKVVDSNDANKRFEATGRDEAARLAPFELAEIVDEIRAGREGLRELVRDGRRVVVSFVRLDTLGWYYVVEIDAVTLGAAATR